MGTRRKRDHTFLWATVVVVLAGAALFGGVLAVRVVAADEGGQQAQLQSPPSYNGVSSYGMTGYAPLKVEPTDETPPFISKRLQDGRGVVLLVYCQGAPDDMQMLSYFNDIKRQYAADTSFFAFEAHDVTQLGDTLTQLRVSDPPVLAIIRGDGEVAQLYTGWIGYQVMEQRIANAVRGL